ncbi:MAG TPA: carbonic anhydrase [Gemmatimonadaceae bacterium]
MTIMRKYAIRLLGAAIATVWFAPPANAQHAHSHWAYEGEGGPTHWGALEPSYKSCAAGKEQSPIDIRDAKAPDLPAIAFSYQPTPLKLVDNGHTIQVSYAPGSFITVGGQRYELQQFHFHHPAEEKVSGKSYPMVAHLVHKNAAGQLAVVAVLLTKGAANPLIAKLWQNLPAEQGKEVNPAGETVDATQLLPSAQGYFTFSGSLTTPPCSEGVTWFVLKTPTEVSSSEVLTFARKYPHNARPTQPLNGRVIKQSQ